MKLEWSGRYVLSRANILLFAPPSPGVYLLWEKRGSEEWRCSHVGEAENIRNRLMGHLGTPPWDGPAGGKERSNGCAFSHAVVQQPLIRDVVCAFLCERMAPTAGRRRVTATPLGANLAKEEA